MTFEQDRPAHLFNGLVTLWSMLYISLEDIDSFIEEWRSRQRPPKFASMVTLRV